MWNKTIEYWIAVATLVVYVASKNAESEPILRRVVKTMVSAGLTLSLSPQVSVKLGINETWAAVIIMSIGFVVLDVFTSTVGNRTFIKSMIRSKFGANDDRKP